MNKAYASFSQSKGLLWRNEFDGILSGDFKPPVGAVIDLTDKCQLFCRWCNGQGFRSANTLETETVKKLIRNLAEWGVRSVCFAGGGEPSLHKDFAKLIEYSYINGLEVGISTNGISLTEKDLIAISDYTRFCGFSIDAGTQKTWQRVKNERGPEEYWRRMLWNAEALNLISKDKKIDTTFKFMLTPYNQHEIFKACKLALELGFKSFFVRPAAFENVPGLEADYKFDTEAIAKQESKCLELETECFKVYGSFKRVDEKLKRIIPFDKCRASPLMAVMCADNYSYLCIDYRERPYGKLCRNEELRKFWGTEAHKKVIYSIQLERCPRCAMMHYNCQIESYKNDDFYMNFP